MAKSTNFTRPHTRLKRFRHMLGVYTNVYAKRIYFVTYQVGRDHTDIEEAHLKTQSNRKPKSKG